MRPVARLASLRDKEVVKQEMRKHRDIIKKAILTDTPPPRNFGSLACNYCKYAYYCFKDYFEEGDDVEIGFPSRQ